MRSKTTIEKCGTCQFWTGNRMPVFDSLGIPKVDIIDTIGQCENVASRFFEDSRMQNAKCKHFSKWTELL